MVAVEAYSNSGSIWWWRHMVVKEAYPFYPLPNDSLISHPTPQKVNNSKLYKGLYIIGGRRRIPYNKYFF
jgi:hypothetical protein